MQGIVNDNAQYAKIVLSCGYRSKFKGTDMSQILEDENVETALKEAAEDGRGCVKVNKNFIKGYFRLAVALREQKKYKEAVDNIKMGLAVDPGNADLKKQSSEMEELMRQREDVIDEEGEALPVKRAGHSLSIIDNDGDRRIWVLQDSKSLGRRHLDGIHARLRYGRLGVEWRVLCGHSINLGGEFKHGRSHRRKR